MSHARVAAGLVALVALAGCGMETGKPCTLIGARVGVGLRVEPPLATRVSDADMRICWDGGCQAPTITLDPATSAGPQSCTGTGPDDTCGVSAVPSGGLVGFADMANLPRRAVQVSVVLHDSSGKRVFDQGLTVTPKDVFANGPGCGAGGPQAHLVVTDGRLRERA
jgi:hypothetical protein